MKRISFVLVFLMVLAGTVAINIGDIQGADNEFVPLFNGKDLDGWINVNCAPETWKVRDEMIICSGLPIGFMRTEKQYQNFIIELDWRHMKKGGNAGLFIHSDALPYRGKAFSRTIEAQILDGNAGDLFGMNGATLTPAIPHKTRKNHAIPSENRMNPTGEWNHYRLVSSDGIVTLAINGKAVTHAYHCTPSRGYICLESEGSEAHFRNIHIKELPDTPLSPDIVALEARGFRSLYNGVDLRGWKNVAGNKNHWQAKDYILSYDGKSEAEGEDRHLWTEEEFGNFILMVDWRLPAEPKIDNVPVIMRDGSNAKDKDSKEITVPVLDAGDSGIYLRGQSKNQINIWNWPVGSGEIWGFRTDENMPADVRRAATPVFNADNPVGEWNRFEIRVIDNYVTVVVNGKTVISGARLPGMPIRGPIALQHHGDRVDFTNIFIKELD